MGLCGKWDFVLRRTLTGLHTRLTFNHLPFPVLMPDTNPSTERRATRPSNAEQHPGLVAVPIRKRRTKAEIERDRAHKEDQKAKKNHQQAQSITRIAELEDRMVIDDASAEGAHPQNQKGSLTRIIIFA